MMSWQPQKGLIGECKYANSASLLCLMMNMRMLLPKWNNEVMVIKIQPYQALKREIS